MTDEEQNSNERKDPPARKAKTGAWWKSVRRSAEAEEKNEGVCDSA